MDRTVVSFGSVTVVTQEVAYVGVLVLAEIPSQVSPETTV